MVEIEGVPLARRALEELRRAGVEELVAVTGYRPEALLSLGDLVTAERRNPQFAHTENIYSLWCARDVVARGCTSSTRTYSSKTRSPAVSSRLPAPRCSSPPTTGSTASR